MSRKNSMRALRKTLALTVALSATGLAVAQTTTASSATPTKVPPKPPSVFVNQRATDDPRIGLKGGLYDAGQAASGLQLLISTPKPAGFAPDLDSIKTVDATPPPPPVDPVTKAPKAKYLRS